ncbi:MAG TPA: ornithine carbamoyltransferase [Acidimicrobiales bacterium]|nr:ornithine carbamoyltransferase [Acidimicrobiales bacterium]
MSARHFLDIDDLTAPELDWVLALSVDPKPEQVLAGHGVALYFEQPSNRTRNSTELAVVELGGHPVVLRDDEVGVDTREPAEDVARVLACYHRVICLRMLEHAKLVRMAKALDDAGMDVPVVNLLSSRAHPCQALADVLTLRDALAPGDSRTTALAGRSIAYIGDANNTCRSLAKAVLAAGMELRLANPADHGFPADELAELEGLAEGAGRGGSLVAAESPAAAAEGADALYADVWTSMGGENGSAARKEAFAGFTIDAALLERAAPGAVVLHCLPAHRGEEITDDVLDGPQSAVWQQVRHRRTAMRGLLAWLVAVGGPEAERGA